MGARAVQGKVLGISGAPVPGVAVSCALNAADPVALASLIVPLVPPEVNFDVPSGFWWRVTLVTTVLAAGTATGYSD
jgi:hypothetical protein